MKKFFLLLQVLILSLLSIAPLSAEDVSPEPYKKEEFPQGLRDLRRFEIISLGALPFVTLDVTLAYSGIRYVQHDFNPAYTPNIFSKSSYTTEEQMGIIFTSLGISVGIGLTDYIVQLVKRSAQKKKDKVKYEDINIYPISEDPDALKIELPNDEQIIEITEDGFISEDVIEVLKEEDSLRNISEENLEITE